MSGVGSGGSTSWLSSWSAVEVSRDERRGLLAGFPDAGLFLLAGVVGACDGDEGATSKEPGVFDDFVVNVSSFGARSSCSLFWDSLVPGNRCLSDPDINKQNKEKHPRRRDRSGLPLVCWPDRSLAFSSA